ncbi:lytic transglycosylase domain-containing protein [Geodermatophilus sp. TF02-6]|uniref:aggregation-promoting factor C-terminal-like domain-containing protein n=1 Tax=Geodermatophilus sp. TF02-6 TaxID=2250575 RepID=UPI000DE8CC2C|nr:lytic transglycosylase domain-containing protein [Geodermatophilus sp. TF02-6]RBY82937.1 lytic transglycosylase domain-containing protein [Geodermatophilus sp. TF02-6]
MDDRTTQLPAAQAAPTTDTPSRRRLRLPAPRRRPAILLATAAAGAVVVAVVGGQPAVDAETQTVTASMGVAEQLGTPSAPAAPESAAGTAIPDLTPLEELAVSRSERAAAQASATQAAANQAERQAAERAAAERAAAEAAAAQAAAEQAAREAAERAAAEQAARQAARQAAEREAAEAAASRTTASPAPQNGSGSSSAAPKGSYQDYALAEVGAERFGCLEKLWGRESDWDPDAQNPSSTAYGIPQFLDSTWKSTGIAKTSDGYRQIDAGLIYIDNTYGSPCAAWAHSQATGWY